ncbi:MAG: DNA polymerase III subunit alpha [Polyangiaceae bacterium]|nr:DNA polymerase III subunit alpha [Polyangiaceae bacterium]
MAAEFVHLHVHTQFSFLVSTVRVAGLPGQVAARGMQAVAITDHQALYGAIKLVKACQEVGVRPILGAELNVAREDGRGHVDHLVALAATADGYRNLLGLVSRGYSTPASDDAPSLTLDDVLANGKGLVVLTGCLGGLGAQRILEQGERGADSVLGRLRDALDPGALYVELQEHGLPEQRVVNRLLAQAAARLGLSCVATNDVHFVERGDADAALTLDCIRTGRSIEDARAAHHGSAEMYLKSPAEMAAAFAEHPSALAATLEIAERCSGWKLELGKPMLPTFPVPEGHDTESWFRHVAREGLAERLARATAAGRAVDEGRYRERLETELQVIAGMKYPGYFLIVWDFIREAKRRGIPVGPGRGSGAGSLVAWSLGITDLDPIPYDLLFERFLNPERVSMPDFDVDFCMHRRDEVLAYVAEKYGRRSVGQIATYQNLKARSVIKDVARTMGFPAQEAQRIASLVPDLGQGKTATIEQALEQEPKLADLRGSDARVSELLERATKLEGLTRHAGMHAAGVVISEGPLDQHVPCFGADGALVTQYDKDDVELAGLVKFDFLGLRTLTLVDIAVRLVNARPDRADSPLDLSTLALDDRETYALIGTGETKGVFQLESQGMQEKVLRPLRPDCFEDVVAAVALYRPGPLGTGMISDFINGKHGRKPTRKLHPAVDGVLAPTYGVPVYQEQVMQIAQRLSGYTLGGADLLRRAMGKKKQKEMDEQKARFIAGAEERGADPAQAAAIFEEIRGFAEYGFNKSHSAAYAVITYQTAYLKAHYPTEFFAATMTADRDKIEKVVRTIAEARAWGVVVLGPDINASEIDFTVDYAHPDGRGPARGPGKLRDRYAPRIRFGLGALRGVGAAALESVFAARSEGGAFKDLFDFADRIDPKRINRGVLESLIQGGAFDAVHEPLGVDRARALAAVERALERARSASRDRERGQSTLFGLFDAARGSGGVERSRVTADEFPAAEPWDRLQRLRRERQALGCFVSGHPLDRYGSVLAQLGTVSTADLAGCKPWSPVTLAGVAEGYSEKLFKNAGDRVGLFELEDKSGRVPARLKGGALDAGGPLLASGELVLVRGKVGFPRTDDAEEATDPTPTLHVDSVEPLSVAAAAVARSLGLRLDAERIDAADLAALAGTLRDAPGGCAVELTLALPAGASATLVVDGMRVSPTDDVLSRLERRFGDTSAELR